ncbi:MAG: aminopeptidase P family protein [Hyphomicrobiales bacterium]|nr:aminopeptidase P family protein [Hyphomicrobiales bacterium]
MIPQGGETVFPKEEYAGRLKALRQAMAERGFELFMTSGPENIFYLTGQQTPGYYIFQCLCVPLAGEPFHVLRTLESMNARLNTLLDDIEGYGDDVQPAAALAAALKRRGWIGKRLAIDRNSWFLTVNLYEQLLAACGPLLDGSGLVEPLRRVKSPREIEQMEKAAAANDAGMQAGLDAVRVGATENDVAAAIMSAAIKAGSEYLGMDPFVTSGPRSGVPHTTWRRRRIEPGDLVALETTACYNRYHAAMFRTVALGNVPQRALDMYRTCDEGLAAAIETLKPGRTCADVHNACQAVIDRDGFTANYRKRTGYSIGISFAPDWGEGNILGLNHDIDVPLEPGMVFHVPVALREWGRFTVAVSETLLVTETAARPLGKLKREMRRA